MDCFLYYSGLRHERVMLTQIPCRICRRSLNVALDSRMKIGVLKTGKKTFNIFFKISASKSGKNQTAL